MQSQKCFTGGQLDGPALVVHCYSDADAIATLAWLQSLGFIAEPVLPFPDIEMDPNAPLPVTLVLGHHTLGAMMGWDEGRPR